jgi:hypothetical protein
MTGGAGVDEILSHLHSIITPSQPLVFYNFSFVSTYFSEMVYEIGSLISSIQSSSNYKLFTTLLLPAIYVIGSEILADLLKHAFITKFNDIPSSIYTGYAHSLYRDLLGVKLDPNTRPKWEANWYSADAETPGKSDRSPIVARRIGFVAIPLASLFTRIVFQTLQMMGVFQLYSNTEFWKRLMHSSAWLLGGYASYFSLYQVKLFTLGVIIFGTYFW